MINWKVHGLGKRVICVHVFTCLWVSILLLLPSLLMAKNCNYFCTNIIGLIFLIYVSQGSFEQMEKKKCCFSCRIQSRITLCILLSYFFDLILHGTFIPFFLDFHYLDNLRLTEALFYRLSFSLFSSFPYD